MERPVALVCGVTNRCRASKFYYLSMYIVYCKSVKENICLVPSAFEL